MKQIPLILALSVCSVFYSCNNTAPSENNSSQITVNHSEEQNQEEAIILDNGKKWKVNDNMLPYILDAEKIFIAYLDNHDVDFKKLAKDLENKNDSLTSNCTMEGQAHDELHKWLLPHLELTEKLSSAESENEAQNQIKELKLSFETFHKYFE
ncbi:MAG: hypothetical protein IT215_01015 [Chitinophagaceae bacterium]|nr:hypothetical protein [Chitinophagaceae bacterium]HMN32793.1 hypothetical protein [Chitinophagaceae bacterium]